MGWVGRLGLGLGFQSGGWRSEETECYPDETIGSAAESALKSTTWAPRHTNFTLRLGEKAGPTERTLSLDMCFEENGITSGVLSCCRGLGIDWVCVAGECVCVCVCPPAEKREWMGSWAGKWRRVVGACSEFVFCLRVWVFVCPDFLCLVSAF